MKYFNSPNYIYNAPLPPMAFTSGHNDFGFTIFYLYLRAHQRRRHDGAYYYPLPTAQRALLFTSAPHYYQHPHQQLVQETDTTLTRQPRTTHDT